MAILTHSLAPANAIRVWTDGRWLFAEIGGYITKFSFTEGGLTKVLHLLGERKLDYSGPPSYRVEAKPNVGTELQQAHAEALMRRLGIL